MCLHEGTTSLSFMMQNEHRAESFGYISFCQLPVFGRPSHGGWIIRLLHFSVVASSHWVGNEKHKFQMPVFTSFIFVIIIYCLSLTVSLSPVVSFLFWNLRLKRLFFLLLSLLCPRYGVLREHKHIIKGWPVSPLCIAALLLTLFLNVVLYMNVHILFHGSVVVLSIETQI